jgi:hypothetical protein
MDSGLNLVEVLRSCRKVYEQENQHLSRAERDKGWKQYWNLVTSQVTGPDSPKMAYVVPKKRSASDVKSVGMEPASKRPGTVGVPEF